MGLTLLATMLLSLNTTSVSSKEDNALRALSIPGLSVEYPRPKFAMSGSYSVGRHNHIGGFGLGVMDIGNWWLLDVKMNFIGPDQQRQIQESEFYYYQYWEERYQVKAKAGKFFFPLKFKTQSLGFYGTIGTSLGWGNFKGTDQSPDRLWEWPFGGGLVWERTSPESDVTVLWKAGYERNRTVPDDDEIGRLRFSFSLITGKRDR